MKTTTMVTALTLALVSTYAAAGLDEHNGKWYDTETRQPYTGSVIGFTPTELMNRYPSMAVGIILLNKMKSLNHIAVELRTSTCGFDTVDGIPQGMVYCMPKYGDKAVTLSMIEQGHIGPVYVIQDPETEKQAIRVEYSTEDRMDGTMYVYDDYYGDVRSEFPFIKLRYHGIAKDYNPKNGALLGTTPFQHGKIHGDAVTLNPDTGHPTRTATYDSGYNTKIVNHDDNGNPIVE